MAVQSLCTDDCVEDVIGRYADMVYRLAFAQTKTQENADDVFQEVFLRYIAKPRRFESEEHRRAWLIRVTLNCCKNLWRTARAPSPAEVPQGIAFECEAQMDLYAALYKLPQKYRSVIHLFYYEDFSVKQIARLLQARESTVRTRLTRARALLRAELKGAYFDEAIQRTDEPDSAE